MNASLSQRTLEKQCNIEIIMIIIIIIIMN